MVISAAPLCDTHRVSISAAAQYGHGAAPPHVARCARDGVRVLRQCVCAFAYTVCLCPYEKWLRTCICYPAWLLSQTSQFMCVKWQREGKKGRWREVDNSKGGRERERKWGHRAVND